MDAKETLQLDESQAEFAICCFKEWLNTCEEAGRRCNGVDAHHSALLRRLLSGKPKLDKAPPKRFSYPCYELGEGKPVHIDSLEDTEGVPSVVIDQTRAWDWVDKRAGMLRHKNGDLYRVHNDQFGQRILQKA